MKSKNNVLIEIFVWLAFLVFSVYAMRSMLIYGKTTLTHDNFYWYYPMYQFFVENIIAGQWPLWNPFTHAGEPFYLSIFQLRLLEPSVILDAYLGHFLTDDVVMLFNWNHFIQSLIMVFGAYIVLRQFTTHLFVRLTLIPILLCSSFFLVSFRQVGTFHQFMWFPYIIYFLFRIVYHADYRWHNFLAFAILIGLNWQSYFFTGTSIFFFFLFLGFLLFRRDLLAGFKFKENFIKIIITGCIIFAMMLPNIVLLLEKNRFVFPARVPEIVANGDKLQYVYVQYEPKRLTESDPLIMSYDFIKQMGSYSMAWDFIQIIAPDGNVYINWTSKPWGAPSESYIYIGFFPWALAIFGMVFGRHNLKKVWLFSIIGFGIFILGPPGGLHKLLYYVYPPLWFVRHTSPLVLFFVFSFLYFYILGLNYILAFFQAANDVGEAKNPLLWVKSRWRDMRYHISSSILFFMLTLIIVMSAYGSDKNNYLFLFILLICIAGWMFLRHMSKGWFFASIIVSQVIIVILLSKNIQFFLGYFVLAFILPLLLIFLTIANRKIIIKTKIIYVMAIFALTLVGDLIYSFLRADYLYAKQDNPNLVCETDTTINRPVLNQIRLIAPPTIYANRKYGDVQSIRYCSLLYRQPFVFSSVEKEHDLFDVGYDKFKQVLSMKRWNSLLMNQNYFKLIQSNIPPEALYEMFAVGKPIFQFKQGVILIDEEKIFPFLIKLGTNKSVKLLQKYVLIERYNNQSLDKIDVIKGDDREKPIELSGKAFKGIRNNLSYREDTKFSYSIKNYNYNSFDIKVYTKDAGILYWSDGYDKYWHAYNDGVEVPIYRANINFKAVSLKKGINNIRVEYKPSMLIKSLIVFYGTLIIFSLGALLYWTFAKFKNRK